MSNLSGVHILPGTSPATISIKGQLYLFYNGGGNDGIWLSHWNGNNWSGLSNLRDSGAPGMNVAQGTGPSVAELNGTVYVFFNGSGNDGTWYTSSRDMHKWTEVKSIDGQLRNNQTFAPNSSPSAVNYNGRIYMFWDEVDTTYIWYCTFDGNSWGPPTIAL